MENLEITTYQTFKNWEYIYIFIYLFLLNKNDVISNQKDYTANFRTLQRGQQNDIYHDLRPDNKGSNIVQRKNNNKTNHIIRENHNNTTTEMTWLKGFCGYSPNICRYVHDLRDMSRKWLGWKGSMGIVQTCGDMCMT